MENQSGTSDSGSSTNGFIPSEETPIFLTDKAVEAVKDAISKAGAEGEGLRISVAGGGCSGYEYQLDFDKEERMGDIIMNFGGINVYVDSVSVGYLKGTVIDYISSLNEQGFKFLNPNAKRTCGCGNSFS
jgi:iron-sulfur cluster assembly accessory protein